MINLSILISSSEISGPGGLFDINATLPLVAIQFVLLTIVLNIILYNPLLTIIEERKEYSLGVDYLNDRTILSLSYANSTLIATSCQTI